MLCWWTEGLWMSGAGHHRRIFQQLRNRHPYASDANSLAALGTGSTLRSRSDSAAALLPGSRP